jgi:hypothetical protein
MSIQSPLSQTSVAESPPPPFPPPRSEKRLSMMSTRSGFQACEAKPVEIPNLPDNAMYMISNASKDSLSQYSRHSHVPRKSKSSVPLLAAIKTSQARMSSIKNIIKTPTHARVPSMIAASRPDSRSSGSRPPTSAADAINDNYNPFETVPANLNEPTKRTSYWPRPKSSHRPSTSGVSSISQQSVTALPIPPPEVMATDPTPQTPGGSMRRKKSFSSLRKRSESIGQAIKFAAMKKPNSRPEDMTSPPPVPLIQTPATRNQSFDLKNFPTPPLPSPRSRKSVASYSPFPPSPRVGGPVGLGLKV